MNSSDTVVKLLYGGRGQKTVNMTGTIEDVVKFKQISDSET